MQGHRCGPVPETRLREGGRPVFLHRGLFEPGLIRPEEPGHVPRAGENVRLAARTASRRSAMVDGCSGQAAHPKRETPELLLRVRLGPAPLKRAADRWVTLRSV